MVLILSGAGDGGGGPTPFPGPDPARSPAPTPRQAPRPPAAAPTRGAAATSTMRPAARLLLPSLLALLAHGKGPWRPAAERGRGRGSGVGREDRPWARLRASGCPARAPRSAGCAAPAPAGPGGARAPRAGSCRGSRHSRLAETSPLIISPDLMGFLCCNSSCPPLPTRTLALTRAPPRHTPGAWRAPGRVLAAGAGGPGAEATGRRVEDAGAARRPAFPSARQTSLDFAAGSEASRPHCGETRPDDGWPRSWDVAHLSLSWRCHAGHGTESTIPGGKVGGPGAPYRVPPSALSCSS